MNVLHPLARGDQLVVASHNDGKLEEFTAMLQPYGLSARSAAQFDLPEPEETGSSFVENARIKALSAARATGLPALADDSGLAVEALDGAPGIYSARWAGPRRDFEQAMRNIEEKLQQCAAVAPNHRGASFICVLCLAMPDGRTWEYQGDVAGQLVWPPRGEGGFGYDPMFQPEGHRRTFAEMSPREKKGDAPSSSASLSHRARAFAAFASAMLDNNG